MSTNTLSESAVKTSVHEEATLFPVDVVIPSSVHPASDEKDSIEDSFAAINASCSSLPLNEVRQDLRFHHRINGQDKTVFISLKLAGGGSGMSRKNKIAPRPSQSGGSLSTAPVLVQVQNSQSSQIQATSSPSTLPSSNAVVHKTQQPENPQKSSTQAVQSPQPPNETPIAPANQNPPPVTPSTLIPAPSVDPAIFVDWSEEPVLESPENGLRLGLLLQKQFDEGNQDEKWRKRALRMIRLFMQEPTATENNLNEIVPLSKASDAEISENLITAIGEKLEKGTEDPTRLLSALNIVLSNTLQQNFNGTLLGTVLDILVDKIGNVFASDEKTSNQMTETIVSILNCLHVSGATGIPQGKYKTYKESFDQSWIDKALEKRGTNEQERAITAVSQAKRALFVELLKRIGDDQDSIVKGAKIAGGVTLGLFNVATAVVSFDVSSAISAFGDAAGALSEIELNKKWFNTYIGFRLSLSSSVQKALEFMDSFKLRAIHLNAAFLIIDCVSECYCATNKGAKRKEVFELLVKLTTYSNWPKDPDLFVYVEIMKRKMLEYKPQKTLLKSNIFDRSGLDELDVSEVIFSIKEATTKNEEFNGRFANYIPCQAERPARKGEAQDAMDLIKEFLSPENQRKVLLILGDSGSGKSLLQQYTVRELWKEFELGKRKPIPLYVPLTALENPREDAIYDLLSAPTKNSMSVQGLEFLEENINSMKNDKQPFIFFLDAFDEIQYSSTSIFQSNKLAEWPNAKVVICCRRQFINNIPNYQKLFASLNNEGDPESIDEIHILPFTKEQRVQYFEKYVELHPECEWKEGAIFEKNLQLIPSLADLTITPFMIFLAATTLPDIYKKKRQESKVNEQIKMMRTEFFRQFAESWFDREDKKLKKSKSFLPYDFPEDFPAFLYEYCRDLAGYMLKENRIALQYQWSERKKKSDNPDLDEFFGNDPEWLDIVRRAAPIKKTSATTYEFIHKSVYEFFAGDTLFNQFTFQEDNAEDEEQEVLESTLPAETTTSASDQSPEKPAPAAVTKEPSRKRLANFALQVLEGKKDNQGLLNALNKTIKYADLLNLSEQVNKNEKLKQSLFDIIHLSKSDETKAQAAANAITILNYAGVSFANMDFSRIRIPGADLSRSILDGTKFTGANLNNVSFIDACLGSCVFNEARMDGVKFGRHPLLLGHTSSVNSVCCVNGANGECWLASGSNDRTIRIWDIATGSEIKTLNGHTDSINSVYSVNRPNGECWLASGSNDKTIRIWDIATGSEIKTLKGHKDSVNSVCSVNGSNGECWLASGSNDKTIVIWDIATGSEIKMLNGHTSAVSSVCSVNGPNGECWLASGSNDKTIRIWDIATGSEIKTLKGRKSIVHSVCSVNGPNGECWLASGSDDKTIVIWDIDSGLVIKILNEHKKAIHSVCSVKGPNGECWLASGSDDKTIRVWDISKRRVIKTLNGHTSSVNSVCSVRGPNGECWLASGSGDKKICVWDIATGSEIKTLNGHTDYVRSVCSVNGPNGECWLASGSGDKKICVWDIATGSEIKTLNGHTDYVRSVCSVNGPNGECWLASGSDDKTIRVWDISKCRVIKTLNGHTGSVYSVCSVRGPNGECWLASGSGDKTIRIWDIVTGSKIKTLNGHTGSAASVCSVNDPNGECWLASGSDDHTIRIWDIATGSEIKTLNGHNDWIRSVCSVNGPNGEFWLASGSHDHRIRIWDIASGLEIKTLNGHTSAVNSVCSVNGPHGECWLVSSSGDEIICIWDLTSGSKTNTMNQYSCPAQSICIIRGLDDERWLAYGGHDCTIRIDCLGYGQQYHEADKIGCNLMDPPKVVTNVQYIDILEQSESITTSSKISNTEYSLVMRTKYIFGPRRLEVRDLQLRNVVGISPLNKTLLLQEGGVSFDKDFFNYCKLGEFNQYQSRMMAWCYAEGCGVDKNIEKSFEWLGKGMNLSALLNHAQIGSSAAFHELLRLGNFKIKNEPKYIEAAGLVAECYTEGWGVEKDLHKAMEWHGRAMNLTPIFNYAQSGSKDAFKLLLTLAEEKKYNQYINHQACKIVAECYDRGWGIEKDSIMAIEWFFNAQDLHSLKMKAKTGYKSAFTMLRRLAEEKEHNQYINTQACKFVAECYARGWGVEKDMKSSTDWYSKILDFDSLRNIAQSGAHEEAQEGFNALLKPAQEREYGNIKYIPAGKMVAECYEQGWGVERNLQISIEWRAKTLDFEYLRKHIQNQSKEAFEIIKNFAEMLEQNRVAKYPAAAKIVAECYENGWIVDKDEEKDHYWQCQNLGGEQNIKLLRDKLRQGSKDAFDTLQKLAEVKRKNGKAKYIEAIKIIAECYENGWGVTKDEPESKKWSCRALGSELNFGTLRRYAREGSKEAFEVLLEFATISGKKGKIKYPEAAKKVSDCYKNGWCVAKDEPESKKWSCRALGSELDFDALKQRVQEESKEAFEVLLEFATISGKKGKIKYPEAVKKIAECYDIGFHMEMDGKKLMKVFVKNHDFTTVRKIVQFRDGYAAFDTLLQLSREVGKYGMVRYPGAAKIVAECYENGWAVEKDEKKAHYWECQNLGGKQDFESLRREVKQGSREALDILQKLAEVKGKNGELRFSEALKIVAECYREGWILENTSRSCVIV